MQKGFEPNKYYTVHSTVRHLHAQSRRAVSLVGVLCGGLYKPCPCIPVHTVMTFLYLSPCKALLRGPPSLTHTQTRLVLELITDCSWLTKRNGGHYSRWLSHSTSFFSTLTLRKWNSSGHFGPHSWLPGYSQHWLCSSQSALWQQKSLKLITRCGNPLEQWQSSVLVFLRFYVGQSRVETQVAFDTFTLNGIQMAGSRAFSAELTLSQWVCILFT